MFYNNCLIILYGKKIFDISDSIISELFYCYGKSQGRVKRCTYSGPGKTMPGGVRVAELSEYFFWTE